MELGEIYMNNKVEYIKLFWKHNFSDEPVVIFYEVDLGNERLAPLHRKRMCIKQLTD